MNDTIKFFRPSYYGNFGQSFPENMAERLHDIGGPGLFIFAMVIIILTPMIICELYLHYTGRSLIKDAFYVMTKEVKDDN
jgi:hypothetical protein